MSNQDSLNPKIFRGIFGGTKSNIKYPPMPLTDIALSSDKPKNKQYKLSDAASLHLLILVELVLICTLDRLARSKLRIVFF